MSALRGQGASETRVLRHFPHHIEQKSPNPASMPLSQWLRAKFCGLFPQPLKARVTI